MFCCRNTFKYFEKQFKMEELDFRKPENSLGDKDEM